MCSVFKVELSQGCPFMNERERERKREREREREAEKLGVLILLCPVN